MSYRDATNTDWKLIIDHWIAKGRDEQRGAIFNGTRKMQTYRKKRRCGKNTLTVLEGGVQNTQETEARINRGKTNNNRNCKGRTNMGGTPIIEMIMTP